MIFEFGTFKVDVDVERTRRFYETVEDQLGCECAGAETFAKRIRCFPMLFKHFFGSLVWISESLQKQPPTTRMTEI